MHFPKLRALMSVMLVVFEQKEAFLGITHQWCGYQIRNKVVKTVFAR